MAGGGKKEDLGIDRSKSLFGRHMVALLKKRLLTFKRDKKMWAFVVLMPALFVLAGILILTSVGSYAEPAILLTPTVSAVQRAARVCCGRAGVRAEFPFCWCAGQDFLLCFMLASRKHPVLRRKKCNIKRWGVMNACSNQCGFSA